MKGLFLKFPFFSFLFLLLVAVVLQGWYVDCGTKVFTHITVAGTQIWGGARDQMISLLHAGQALSQTPGPLFLEFFIKSNFPLTLMLEK